MWAAPTAAFAQADQQSASLHQLYVGRRETRPRTLRLAAHAFRVTAATNELEHQADIAKMQEWLGHANFATTRIYDHQDTGPEDGPSP